MTKDNQIEIASYKNLLGEIKNKIQETGKKIATTAIRQKVELCWQMGKLISEDILQNNRAGYGENLFKKLETDLNINQRSLYQMQDFYKSYPQIPKNDANLNWTHYRTLAQIKDDSVRKNMENLVIENSWGTNHLAKEIKNLKPEKTKINTSKSQLKPIRGQLFSYPLVEINEKIFLDLGFNIFKEIEENLPSNLQKVDVSKDDQKYSFTKSILPAKKFNTYKAYLDRIVDGDTIRVTIDLGFKILHKEIIRLKAINTPERGTKGGKESTQFVTDIFNNVEFFVIKTIKNDIFGRYVADIFLPSGEEKNPQEIADHGIYLNQILLDEGLAVILD
ncbi:MAG: endonuclease YncB(thermonuclease family) [Rickettsiales bacterium]|jgi:endonuclease YncB( thermonuclease family)